MSPKFCSLAVEEEISDRHYRPELKLLVKEAPINIGHAPYHAEAGLQAIAITGRMTVSF